MKLYQDAWFLFVTEIKRSKLSVAMVIAMIMFTILLSAPTYFQILELSHPTFRGEIHFIADYIFVLTFGSAGVLITFLYGGGFKRDVLADRLAYYRSLPISTEHIVLSKIMSALVGTFLSLMLYYVVTLTSFSVFADLNFQALGYEFFVHIVVLYAVMIILNYIFVWVDLCKTYKWYTMFSFVFVFIVLVGTILLQALSDNKLSIIVTVYNFSIASPLLALLVSLVVLILSTWLAFKVVTSSLRKRNLG